MRRRIFLLITVAVSWLTLSPAGAVPRPGRVAALPPLMLWAWERPTDLRALDGGAGVAFYAQTLRIAGNDVAVRPRRNPLRVSERTVLVAVTRIESDGNGELSDRTIVRLADAIAGTAQLPRVSGVQIDFDAAASERDAYRRIIRAARQRVDRALPLSITALASWCAGDRWLEGLPVDEVVPMLFRLGPVNAPYAAIGTTPSAAAAPCRAAVGVSLDEPIYGRRHARRVYVFNPAPWTAAGVARAREVLE